MDLKFTNPWRKPSKNQQHQRGQKGQEHEEGRQEAAFSSGCSSSGVMMLVLVMVVRHVKKCGRFNTFWLKSFHITSDSMAESFPVSFRSAFFGCQVWFLKITALPTCFFLIVISIAWTWANKYNDCWHLMHNSILIILDEWHLNASATFLVVQLSNCHIFHRRWNFVRVLSHADMWDVQFRLFLIWFWLANTWKFNSPETVPSPKGKETSRLPSISTRGKTRCQTSGFPRQGPRSQVPRISEGANFVQMDLHLIPWCPGISCRSMISWKSTESLTERWKGLGGKHQHIFHVYINIYIYLLYIYIYICPSLGFNDTRIFYMYTSCINVHVPCSFFRSARSCLCGVGKPNPQVFHHRQMADAEDRKGSNPK